MDRRKAWVTLLTSPRYLPGAVVLDYSLKAVGSKYPCVVMISPDLPEEVTDVLKRRGIETIVVNKLEVSKAQEKVKDIRFIDTWTKLRYVCFI